ncbi:MAG TPA: prepilin-type N-terminal cleavage/methylation domain-containing protein [Amnibacterium sp.]
MSITTALKARREALTDREAGFTLIELLVVVIIIGILAAVAIPIYIGVQNNAKDSAVKSDLVNAKTSVVAYATDNNGSSPTVANFNATTLGKYGFGQSTNTKSYTYKVATDNTFCIIGLSSTGQSFYVTSSGNVTTGAACPATW